MPAKAVASPPSLLIEVRELILSTQQTVARGVNAALVMLNWNIGQRIRQDILLNKRAEYGAEILPTLSAKLGWSHFAEHLTALPPKKLLEQKLHHAVQLAQQRLFQHE